jgi:hypothetical protein
MRRDHNDTEAKCDDAERYVTASLFLRGSAIMTRIAQHLTSKIILREALDDIQIAFVT